MHSFPEAEGAEFDKDEEVGFESEKAEFGEEAGFDDEKAEIEEEVTVE